MSGPPELEPSDLWRRITEVPRPTLLVDFPRNDPATKAPIGALRVWVLTHEEQLSACAAAEAKTRKLLREAAKDLPRADEAKAGYEDVYNNAAASELLFRACRDSDRIERPFFPTPAAVDSLSVDEIGVLLNAYHEAQATLGPIAASLTEDEYKAWVRVLAEGATRFPFERLSLGLRNMLMRRLASDLWTFWTATSSPGAPPGHSSSAADDNGHAVAA